ncbi:hypothetical protein WG66_006521 [Moniliophthora roreri]|nr:hypothetical protein WG66_006521 [Moniliophthora roreri]
MARHSICPVTSSRENRTSPSFSHALDEFIPPPLSLPKSSIIMSPFPPPGLQHRSRRPTNTRYPELQHPLTSTVLATIATLGVDAGSSEWK